MFSGVCEYGLLRLEFGLDGTFQDDFFTISPILASSEMEWEYEQVPSAYTLAEKRTQYDEKTERGNS